MFALYRLYQRKSYPAILSDSISRRNWLKHENTIQFKYTRPEHKDKTQTTYIRIDNV